MKKVSHEIDSPIGLSPSATLAGWTSLARFEEPAAYLASTSAGWAGLLSAASSCGLLS